MLPLYLLVVWIQGDQFLHNATLNLICDKKNANVIIKKTKTNYWSYLAKANLKQANQLWKLFLHILQMTEIKLMKNSQT